MRRRPTRSTLFPSTTCFRSHGAGGERHAHAAAVGVDPFGDVGDLGQRAALLGRGAGQLLDEDGDADAPPSGGVEAVLEDRKSTRLNSSHANIWNAVFCFKKK